MILGNELFLAGILRSHRRDFIDLHKRANIYPEERINRREIAICRDVLTHSDQFRIDKKKKKTVVIIFTYLCALFVCVCLFC